MYIAARTQTASRIVGRIVEELRGDPALLQRCIGAFMRMSTFETDIILAQVALLEAIKLLTSGAARASSSSVALRISFWPAPNSQGADRAHRSTATSARGMLGKTSEVAAAAEQSAVAMREAAQTAAGLIRAIEDARSEVEVAAGVATRAGDQASQAVKVSQALSAHVEAIEIDSQPDPRHCGPDQPSRAQRHNRSRPRWRCWPRLRGRCSGSEKPRFTDRASHGRHHRQDHRDPAGDATDRRSQRIDQGTVEEVQSSADRIREAMELQAQTVTMITAAVDETTLAADLDELNHRGDPQRHRELAKDIDQVGTGLQPVQRADRDFKSTARPCVNRIAA